MLERALFLARQFARDQRRITRRRRKLVREGMPMCELMEPPAPPLAGWRQQAKALFGEPEPGGPIWAVMMAQNEEVRVATPVRHLFAWSWRTTSPPTARPRCSQKSLGNFPSSSSTIE